MALEASSSIKENKERVMELLKPEFMSSEGYGSQETCTVKKMIEVGIEPWQLDQK